MGLFDVEDETPPAQGAGGLLGAGVLGAVTAANVVVKPLPGTTLASIPAPYEPTGQARLSEEEREHLQACRAGVDNLRAAFWIAGKSLETLRTAQLHREENPNFAAWVWDEWEISESQMHRLMDEWRVGEELSNLGHKPLESQVRALIEVRRQTSDRVAVTVYDTIARCVPRVTGKIVGDVVGRLGFLPKDIQPTEVDRRVRELLQPASPKTGFGDASQREEAHNITSLGEDSGDSPIGESSPQASSGKAEQVDARDIERLENTLAALKEAAKHVTKAASRRAVEEQPQAAVPLIEAIGAELQRIDRAVAIRLPKSE